MGAHAPGRGEEGLADPAAPELSPDGETQLRHAVRDEAISLAGETGGPAALLSTPAPYLLVLVSVVATVLQQSAFHAGSLQTSVPTMLVIEPMAAVLLGVFLL